MDMKGYAGKILRIDLTNNEVADSPTSDYAAKFLGGRGIALKIHWDEVPPEIGPYDPENRLVFMTGPSCGIPGLAGSRWQVSAKSPVHDCFSYCNLGGSWGAQLKFAGYDGLVVHGRADSLTYIFIDDGLVEIRSAEHLKGLGAIQTRKKLKEELGREYRVVAVGPAGENMVGFATLTADLDSSGSNGIGAVMGSKNLKAVVVRGSGKVQVADPETLRRLKRHVKELKPQKNDWPTMLPQDQLKKEVCFGCIEGCMRQSFMTKDGREGKYICQSAVWYETRAHRYYGEVNEVPFIANKMCDDYGVHTRVIETTIMWLVRGFKSGILTEQNTGLPLTKIGSLEFVEALLQMISKREGFGDVLAKGPIEAARRVGQGTEEFITDYTTKSGENPVYGPRQYIATGLMYAMEPRQPIQQLHEISFLTMMWAAREEGLMPNYMTSDVIRAIGKKFWGSEIAADFSTYEGKALAAAKIQDRQYAKECMIVCDFSWPIYHTPHTDDHVGDPSLESQVCRAITGMDIDEEGYYRIGARAFNLMRAILVREGQSGRDKDTIEEFNYTVPLKGDWGNPECLVPGRAGEPFSRKGMVVDRDKFEEMKSEFYRFRGWDVKTGFQTRECFEGLDLADVADQLAQSGLLGG